MIHGPFVLLIVSIFLITIIHSTAFFSKMVHSFVYFIISILILILIPRIWCFSVWFLDHLVYSIAASTNKEFLIWGTYGSSSFSKLFH